MSNTTTFITEIVNSDSSAGTVLGAICISILSLGGIAGGYRYYLQLAAKKLGGRGQAGTSADAVTVEVKEDSSDAHISNHLKLTKSLTNITISKNDVAEVKKMLELMKTPHTMV